MHDTLHCTALHLVARGPGERSVRLPYPCWTRGPARPQKNVGWLGALCFDITNLLEYLDSKLALTEDSGSNPYHNLHLHGKGLSDSSPRLCHHHRMRPCLTTTWCLLRSSSGLCVPATVSLKAESIRHFSSAIARLSEPDYAAARRWQAQLGTTPIIDEIGEVSYARSSGPGGQNVNKYVFPTSIESGHY